VKHESARANTLASGDISPGMTTSDRPQGSSAERFRLCFQAHWAAVHNYLRWRGAGADCDDLASEVFATAWRRWPSVPEDQLPWLLRTARNHLANHRRAQQRRAGIGYDPATEDSPDRIAEVAEDVRELLAAVGRLPELEREVLLLVAWDGLTAKQAARVVGCLAGTARARLYRARRRLETERRSNAKPPLRAVPTVEELRSNA
jgi:RNA polymerase sigma factor (sigma-70 family)